MQQIKKRAVHICTLQSFKIHNFSKASSQESSLLLTKNSQHFGALRTVIMEKFISLSKSPNAGKLGMSAVFQRQTILCSHITHQIKSLFLCKPSEKARTKVRTSMVHQWLPINNFFCFWLGNCYVPTGLYLIYSKILFPVSVHLSLRLLFSNKRGFGTAFTSNVMTEENTQTEQNTSPNF